MELKELSLYHLVKEPRERKEKSPLLIMLHGYGSDANDLFSIELKNGNKEMIRGYENTLKYNGAFSSTMKARRVIY